MRIYPKRVVAEVSGRQTNLAIVNPGNPNFFGGVVSLAGLPAGQRSVVVTAMDGFSNTGSAQNIFIIDRPPSVNIIQPESGLVVQRFLPI